MRALSLLFFPKQASTGVGILICQFYDTRLLSAEW